jgi:hypothetical protein
MAADERVLGAMHTAVAEVFIEALKGQEMPGYTDPDSGEVFAPTKMLPSAAILQAATKFLKDNNITCAPSESNKLGELEGLMKARKDAAAVRKATRMDLADAAEQTGFLRGLPN